MRFTGPRSALHFLAAHPLIIGLPGARHPSPGESGGGPAPADPGLMPFFAATADPMILFGPDFIVHMANAAADRLLRMPVGHLLGRSVLESALLARVLGDANVPQRLRDPATRSR
jgi:hypothetical protein